MVLSIVRRMLGLVILLVLILAPPLLARNPVARLTSEQMSTLVAGQYDFPDSCCTQDPNCLPPTK
jgi:hypothetical protein